MLHRTLQPSFVDGRLLPAGSIVDIEPIKAGPHHERVTEEHPVAAPKLTAITPPKQEFPPYEPNLHPSQPHSEAPKPIAKPTVAVKGAKPTPLDNKIDK